MDLESNCLGAQSVFFQNPPSISGHACVVGKKEGEGPLKNSFDYISDDSFFGEKTWEKAENAMVKMAFELALDKASLSPSAVRALFAGDLLNQCTGTSFGLRGASVPFFGVFGACSTMAEGLCLAAMSIDGGFSACSAALTSSHFCSAERQFRLPLEYGGQRTPTAQWTATAAGAVLLSKSGTGPRITHITTGKIVDAGITDANNMGAAMAPAACDTLNAHFHDTGRSPSYYDAVITGDLGHFGHDILAHLAHAEHTSFPNIFTDCGILLYDSKTQDVHAGGSGCGCSAAVLCSYVFQKMLDRTYRSVLFVGTGALLSPTSSLQGESVPGIAHGVLLTSD